MCSLDWLHREAEPVARIHTEWKETQQQTQAECSSTGRLMKSSGPFQHGAGKKEAFFSTVWTLGNPPTPPAATPPTAVQ